MARKTEHDEHCKSIAKRLDQIVNGELFTDQHGQEWTIYDNGEEFEEYITTEYRYNAEGLTRCEVIATSEDGYTWTRDDDGEAVELEQMSLYDEFTDNIYNIEYRIADKYSDPSSVQLMIACGGPNIYLDTKSGDVELYWWSESGRYPMSREVVDALDEFAVELYNC